MNKSYQTELTREQLYEKVWSTPTIQVAAELGISDVALAKRCKKLNVPKPSLGYWARVAAGQKPEKEPLPAAAPTANEIFALAAEKSVPKTLPLPETVEQLHPLAAELLRTLRAAKPSYDKRLWSKGPTLPEVKVSKGSVEQAAKCFHVILANVEAVGILFRKAQGYGSGFFRKGQDRLYLEIEEEMIASLEVGRRRSWQPEELRVPSEKMTFSLNSERYSSRDSKQFKEDEKSAIGTLIAEVVAGIRKHFVDAARRRDREAIESKRRTIEWEKQRREYAEKEAIRLAQERKENHEAALKATEQARSEDLLKAAEWWRLYNTAAEFIDECERRWRADSAELTAEQQAWLAWARENAKSMSPFEMGYPDPAKDGAFDKEAIPLGGPYPAKRDFPRPPTMPKIPPPVIQQSGYGSSHGPEPPPQYPFWLKYQGR